MRTCAKSLRRPNLHGALACRLCTTAMHASNRKRDNARARTCVTPGKIQKRLLAPWGRPGPRRRTEQTRATGPTLQMCCQRRRQDGHAPWLLSMAHAAPFAFPTPARLVIYRQPSKSTVSLLAHGDERTMGQRRHDQHQRTPLPKVSQPHGRCEAPQCKFLPRFDAAGATSTKRIKTQHNSSSRNTARRAYRTCSPSAADRGKSTLNSKSCAASVDRREKNKSTGTREYANPAWLPGWARSRTWTAP